MMNAYQTVLSCSECGKKLRLLTPKEVEIMPAQPPEATCSTSVLIHHISVEPCYACIARKTEKADALLDAIKDITNG